MSAPRIICIAGSPRRRGNSEQLLDACMKGVRAAGGEPEKLVALESGVRPCQGCNACSITGECVIHDPMQDLYETFESADGVIAASPVFFATVPATMKILLDRLQPYWARHYVLKQPLPAKKPGALLIVAAGGANPYGAGCAIKPLRSALGVAGVEMIDVLEVFGVDSPSDLGRHPDAIQRATEIGEAVARAALNGVS